MISWSLKIEPGRRDQIDSTFDFNINLCHHYRINGYVVRRIPSLVAHTPKGNERMLFVYRVDQNESVNSSFNDKPLIYLGFQVRERIIHKCRQSPVFSSGQAFKNLESQHGLPPPRQFLVDRTMFCWKAVLMKTSRCHSPSNTSQGERSNNHSSPLTIIDLSYPM